MNGKIENINIPATPLNNVHFGLVFYFPLIGKSLPDCRPRRLDGGFIFNQIHGGKDMEATSVDRQSIGLTTADVQISRYEDRRSKEDARRFEEYTQKDVAQALARRGF